jgi:peptide/nickel transport system permease protein
MSYLRNRLLQAFITLYGIITIGFFAMRLMPGGPREYLISRVKSNPEEFGLDRSPTPQQINQILEQFLAAPPDKPVYIAYIDYLEGVFLHLDFGYSYIVSPGSEVLPLILEAAPWTILLSSISIVYGLFVGIILGSVMAYYEGTKFDIGMTTAMILDSAVPYYVAAVVLLYYFAYQYPIFPNGGRWDPNTTPGLNIPFILGVYYHAALPSLSMIITGFGGGALGMRANSIRIIGSDYIHVARLRGLSTYKISTRYLARNAILPMYTGIVIGIGGILGGSVILETIFGYAGMGQLMYQATMARDFPVITAALIITTTLFVFGTLLADFTYALIDPRAEQSSMG